MLGADKMASVMRQMENLRNSSEAVKKAFELVPKDTAADKVTEEALGYLAEIAPKHSVMRRIMAAVRAFLFKHFGMNLTDDAMVSLLQSSLNKVNREAGMVEGRVFQEAMASRSYNTRTEYENRIDELFKPGAKANLKGGVRILDKSDVLGMFGLGNKPVELVEGKVIKNITAHSLTASDMKKVPQWLEDPAFVFDSDSERDSGRLVFIAKELKNGWPISIIVEPSESKTSVHLMVNAYDRSKGETPFNRWVRDGLLRYYDKNKSAGLARSGLQLPGLAQARRSDGLKIYRDSDLVKYKKAASEEIKYSLRTKPNEQSYLQKLVADVVALEQKVDAAYENNDPSADALDEQLSILKDKMESAISESEETEDSFDSEVSLDEDLANSYHTMVVKNLVGYTEQDAISNFRDAFANAGADKAVKASDSEIMAAAKAAYDRAASRPRYSTASTAIAAAREALANVTTTSITSGLKNLLPHNAVKSLADHLPGVSDALGFLFRTPEFAAEADARNRKEGEVGKTDYVRVGEQRQMNNMETLLSLMGYDGPNADKPGQPSGASEINLVSRVDMPRIQVPGVEIYLPLPGRAIFFQKKSGQN